jgi:transcriptional regulator with PAS, ATPase and Fis domain
VVAATNKNPAQAVQDGLVREDLYYRLNVFSIQLPPLRERREDLPLLIRSFLEEFKGKYGTAVCSVDAGALTVLTEYDWPGNVRELRNVLERAVLVAQNNMITTDDLPPNFSSYRRRSIREPDFSVGITIDAAEQALILATLERTHQNKTKAAEILGISLKTLHNKLTRYREEASSRADPQE